MSEHTAGRLVVRGLRLYREGDGSQCIASLIGNNQPHCWEDLRRLAACWNVCEGISTEVLELNATAGGVATLERQRDEALAAVEEWFCDACRTVFPRGHVKGFDISCPCRRGATLRPSSSGQLKVEAQRDELLAALKIAVKQNEHDMQMTGEELRIARAAIAKVKPTPTGQ